MRDAARCCDSPAIEQLIGMKAPQLPEATQSRAGAQLLRNLWRKSYFGSLASGPRVNSLLYAFIKLDTHTKDTPRLQRYNLQHLRYA
jgi:hypothetical protein